MAAAAVVTLHASVVPGMVKGQYVCDAVPATTNVILGFIPSLVMGWNTSDGDQFFLWSAGMANGKCLKNLGGTQTFAASGGVTPLSSVTVGATRGGYGFSVGTDNGVQEASKTFDFVAYR